MESSLKVELQHVTFPEFHKSWFLKKITAQVFNAQCCYNTIIGQDALFKMGAVINFKQRKITWDNVHVPMRPFLTSETKNTSQWLWSLN